MEREEWLGLSPHKLGEMCCMEFVGSFECFGFGMWNPQGQVGFDVGCTQRRWSIPYCGWVGI